MSNTNELVERLRFGIRDVETGEPLDEGAYAHVTVDDIRAVLAVLSPVEAVPVAGELPDDMRVPLHSLQADLDWLVARIRAEDDEGVGMCKDSIRSRLSQIEEAAYRLNHAALAHPPAQAGAVTEAMVEAAAKSLRPDLFTPIKADVLQSDDYALTCRRNAKIDVMGKARAALTAALGVQTPPVNQSEGKCQTCAGTGYLDKGGARIAIQRTPCPDCNQSEGADRG